LVFDIYISTFKKVKKIIYFEYFKCVNFAPLLKKVEQNKQHLALSSAESFPKVEEEQTFLFIYIYLYFNFTFFPKKKFMKKYFSFFTT
jgi:hypothetical protein